MSRSMDMKLKKQFRTLSADLIRADGTEPSDVCEFSFSSEAPVERWFGQEILSHEKKSVDMSRMNDGANVLWNHDPDNVIGVVKKAWIGDDKRGYLQMRWGTSALAQEKRKDVEAGIIRNVSFGYQIKEMTLTNPGAKDEDPRYLATKWMPFEGSFVSIPADQTVGMGRSEGDEPTEVTVINPMKGESRKMEKTVEQPTVDTAAIRKEAIEAERVRSAAISALGEKFKKPDLARQLIEGGKDLEAARGAFLDAIGAKQVALTGNEAEVGMSEKEKRSYSWVRAMHYLANPHDRKAVESAAFEREVSLAAAEKSGKASRGLMVPVDMLRYAAKRDLVVGTSTAGGNLVATELDSASFIELLRNKSVIQKGGATVLNGLVGNIAIPKQTGASTAYWVAESGSPTESAQTVGQVSMSPKTVGAYTDYSRKLLLQSSIDVENFVRNDLAAVIALELDRVAMYGTGSSNQPQGMKTAIASGSNEINFAAATPTFAEVVSLESAITAANADLGSMKYLINASMQGSLKSAVKVSNFPVFILENGMMNGYPVLMSNQVASGDVWFGDFSQLLMGFWSGLDLMVDPYSQSTSGTVRIVALQDCDLALRHKESIARGNDTP